MVKSLNIVPTTGTKTSFNEHRLDLYTDLELSDLYRIALSVEGKIARISPELYYNLIDFNNRIHSRNNPRKVYKPDLASFKKAEKYEGKGNEYVLELDRFKYLHELGHFAKKDEQVKKMMVVVSQKSERILGMGYEVKKGSVEKVRGYIRYSTLTEKRQKAEMIMRLMSQRYGEIFELKN